MEPNKRTEQPLSLEQLAASHGLDLDADPVANDLTAEYEIPASLRGNDDYAEDCRHPQFEAGRCTECGAPDPGPINFDFTDLNPSDGMARFDDPLSEQYLAWQRSMRLRYEEPALDAQDTLVVTIEELSGYMRPCEACSGSGVERNGKYMRPCSECDGAGIRAEDETPPPPAKQAAFDYFPSQGIVLLHGNNRVDNELLIRDWCAAGLLNESQVRRFHSISDPLLIIRQVRNRLAEKGGLVLLACTYGTLDEMDERGESELRAFADVVFNASSYAGAMTLHMEKNRHGAKQADRRYRIVGEAGASRLAETERNDEPDWLAFDHDKPFDFVWVCDQIDHAGRHGEYIGELSDDGQIAIMAVDTLGGHCWWLAAHRDGRWWIGSGDDAAITPWIAVRQAAEWLTEHVDNPVLPHDHERIIGFMQDIIRLLRLAAPQRLDAFQQQAVIECLALSSAQDERNADLTEQTQ